MALLNEQSFLDLLLSVQEHSRTMICTVPTDPTKIVNVNLETREIELAKSAYYSFLSVRKEHYAETIYFRVPRYFDGVDLMSMALVVEYVNAKGNSYVSPILVRDIATEPGYILFGWNLHGNATEAAGNLQFALRFFNVNSQSRELCYSLRTKPAVGKILYGVQNYSDTPNSEEGLLNNYALDDVISKIAEQTTVWWNNL